uniref:Peptidase M12B domain-containing protein n=1 Tax=Clastoptera arizonana TaxID=38151 RepID=A0A1B6CER3_9HEMI
MFGAFGNIAFFILLVPYIESANRLNEYISHYEPVEYDAANLHRAHSRAKRSVTIDNTVHLHFSAHNRAFHIRLKRDLTTFSDNLEVVDYKNDLISNVDTSHIYHGHLLGETGSKVFGSIHDGIFEGKIISPTGSYYVEKSNKYFPNNANISFHSLVYKEADVEDPYAHMRTGHVGGCGITDSVSQWMEQIQTSALEEEYDVDQQLEQTKTKKLPKKFVKSDKVIIDELKKKKWQDYENETPYTKYSAEANNGFRSKRATRPKEENKNTCSLFIQTDPLIWRHITEQVGYDPEKTREEILSLIAHHVTAVNYIYRDTKFDGRVEHRNIKFEVQRIKIDDDIPCRPMYTGESNPFCMENIDVSNFLNLHSLGNHEDFCLAYVFTYRDFTGGTLGLAWVASASGASGGICEKYKTYTETVGGMYQSTKRSLNTGIITFVNYNSRVPPKVSQLTLAHEIGHNFGSPHDYPPDCRPGGLNGNYIMFASATSGDRPNNSKFSSCSVGNISNVLDAIEDKKKKELF